MTKNKLKHEVLAQLAVIILDVSSWGTWEGYNLTEADESRLKEVCLELREEFLRRAGSKTAFDGVSVKLRDGVT